MVVHACHPSNWEVEVGGLEVKGCPWPHNTIKASLGYVRLYLVN